MSGNKAIALNLAQWVFKQKGVLRVGKVAHHLQGEKESPHAYTVMQNVVSTDFQLIKALALFML